MGRGMQEKTIGKLLKDKYLHAFSKNATSAGNCLSRPDLSDVTCISTNGILDLSLTLSSIFLILCA